MVKSCTVRTHRLPRCPPISRQGCPLFRFLFADLRRNEAFSLRGCWGKPNLVVALLEGDLGRHGLARRRPTRSAASSSSINILAAHKSPVEDALPSARRRSVHGTSTVVGRKKNIVHRQKELGMGRRLDGEEEAKSTGRRAMGFSTAVPHTWGLSSGHEPPVRRRPPRQNSLCTKSQRFALFFLKETTDRNFPTIRWVDLIWPAAPKDAATGPADISDG